MRRKKETGGAHHQAGCQSQGNRLYAGHRGSLAVFLAHPARYHGRGRQAQPHAGRIHDGEHRLNQADRGDGVGAQVRHPKDIHDGEERFHEHLEHHGHSQEEDRLRQAARGVVLVCAAQRFAQRFPEGRRFVSGDGSSHN